MVHEINHHYKLVPKSMRCSPVQYYPGQHGNCPAAFVRFPILRRCWRDKESISLLVLTQAELITRGVCFHWSFHQHRSSTLDHWPSRALSDVWLLYPVHSRTLRSQKRRWWTKQRRSPKGQSAYLSFCCGRVWAWGIIYPQHFPWAGLKYGNSDV